LIGREEVPEGRRVWKICLRIAFLRVDEGWKLHTITDEEHRGRIHYHIEVAFLRVELDSETTWIASRVSGPFFATYCAETDGNWSGLADLRKEICGCLVLLATRRRAEACITYYIRNIVGNLELPESTTPFSMNHTFRDSLSIKMRKQIY
jgi:hypothetical protein